jgi:hypothetical protein
MKLNSNNSVVNELKYIHVDIVTPIIFVFSRRGIDELRNNVLVFALYN